MPRERREREPGPNASRRLVDLLLEGPRRSGVLVLYDHRIVREWREVLGRRHLRVPQRLARKVIDRLVQIGNRYRIVAASGLVVPDPDDLMFVEVALAGRARVIATFDSRGFPQSMSSLGFMVAEAWDVLRLLGR